MAELRTTIWKYTKLLCWLILGVWALFTFVWLFFPAELGYTWAKFDLMRNHYEWRIFGLSYGDRYNAELLEPYGIFYVRVAGCVVNTPIIESTKAYNAVMREAIQQDLGIDIKKLLYDD